MLHKCACGGNKIIMEINCRLTWPGQYQWHCDTCENHGIGWSFGPRERNLDQEYFETADEAHDDHRNW